VLVLVFFPETVGTAFAGFVDIHKRITDRFHIAAIGNLAQCSHGVFGVGQRFCKFLRLVPDCRQCHGVFDIRPFREDRMQFSAQICDGLRMVGNLVRVSGQTPCLPGNRTGMAF
jgi:hypothetical protein